MSFTSLYVSSFSRFKRTLGPLSDTVNLVLGEGTVGESRGTILSRWDPRDEVRPRRFFCSEGEEGRGSDSEVKRDLPCSTVVKKRGGVGTGRSIMSLR